MSENRKIGKCKECGKPWLCDPAKFKIDVKAFKKLNRRSPMHCDCIKQGEIVIDDRLGYYR